MAKQNRPATSRSAAPKRSGAAKPNPALKDLEMLVGVWDVEISNATFLPNPSATVHGRTSFEWIEGGDSMVIRQGSKASGPPYATWLIGRDEAADDYVVLYFDDRRVSRVYHMRFRDGDWQLWRQAPGNTINANWEMSRDDGKTWQHDFDLTYRRLQQRSNRRVSIS
jgi:hypothetical protein